MATLAAIKALGSSIKADIVDAVSSVKAGIDMRRSEREVIDNFRSLLREDPALVAKAFKSMTEKPVRKPRKAQEA
jgi:hypothetical protein